MPLLIILAILAVAVYYLGKKSTACGVTFSLIAIVLSAAAIVAYAFASGALTIVHR